MKYNAMGLSLRYFTLMSLKVHSHMFSHLNSTLIKLNTNLLHQHPLATNESSIINYNSTFTRLRILNIKSTCFEQVFFLFMYYLKLKALIVIFIVNECERWRFKSLLLILISHSRIYIHLYTVIKSYHKSSILLGHICICVA